MLKFIIDILKYVHHNPKNVKPEIIQDVVQFFVNKWDKILPEFETNTAQRLAGIDLIVKLAFVASKPLYLYARNNRTIAKWTISLLEYEESGWSVEAALSFKSEVINVIPCIIGHTDECDTELRKSMQFLKSKYFNVSRNSNMAYITTFEKLLKALKISTSNILLENIMEIYVASFLNNNEIELHSSLTSFIRYMPPEIQVKSIHSMYNMCFNISKFNDNQRYLLANCVLSILIQNCFYSPFEKFYVTIITNIMDTLAEGMASFNLTCITNKTIALILVELLFLRIKIEGFQNNDCLISKAAFPSTAPSEKPLLKKLTAHALNALKENYNIDNKEEKEILRRYKCHSYNTLVSLVSNTQKEITLYNKWLFSCEDSNKQNILWTSIIDCDKKYFFNIDFDVLPTMKKFLVSIRSSLHEERKQTGSDTHTVNYIESQHLFNSTLSEDITKYDFTTSILRSQTDNATETVTQKLNITLDSVDANEHECMATICGLIQHMVENYISSLPLEGEDFSLPVWMNLIWKTMMDESTHTNIRIFLAKVIYNTQDCFKPYAKWFLAPIIKLIVDRCLGNHINYFSVDLVIMLTSWSIVAIPTEDRLLASQLLKFLMENANHDRRDIFKNNLEQVKLIVETWKKCLDIPYDILLAEIQNHQNSQKLDVGIHLAAILLANNIPPWRPNEAKNFLMTLSKILNKNVHRKLYSPCSEVLGMSLRFMANNNISVLDNFSGYLHSCLAKLTSDEDKFAYCLQGIALHYPVIAEKYLLQMVSKLPKFYGSFKCLYLRIFLARLDFLVTKNELPSINFLKLLADDNFEVQVVTLEIIKESVHHFKISELLSILQEASKLTTNPFPICRNLVFDIFINAYNTYEGNQNDAAKEVVNVSKDILLQGFTDQDSAIQEKLFTFWSNANNVPRDISRRFLFLLSDMYKSNIEEHYMGYSTYLLLNTIKSCEEFEEKLFERSLFECNFEEYQLITNWRRQHASIVPLFADTLSSQDSSVSLMRPDVLRATVSTLQFEPTQTQSRSQFTNAPSTLLFSSSDTGVFKDPNVVLPKRQSHRGRRFLKDKTKITRYFAHLEVRKSLKTEELRKERTKLAERNVNVCRKYRLGDYPDTEITLSSIINPLQMLARCDANLARNLYISLFTSLINKERKDDSDFKDYFLQNVTLSLNNIFTSSTQYIPNTIGTFLDIALAYKSKMKFDAEVISSVCLSSGLLSVGSLLLEEYLISELDDELPSKIRKGIEDQYTLHWVKFAELYKEMEEWDTVRAVFLEKMNCNETVLSAIEAESSGNWKAAQDYYSTVLKDDVSQERKDFYYESYFKCIAALADWETLSKVIYSTLDANENNIWNSLWDDDWNQQKILPWYITAEMHNKLNGGRGNFLTSIQQCLADPDKLEYLKYNFGEDVTMSYVLQNNFDTAKHYLNITLSNFLENWSQLNPLFVKLRGNKILNLRNIIDIYLCMNIINSLKDDEKIDVYGLFAPWLNSTCGNLESLMLYETRAVYRNQFISLIKNKCNSLFGDDGIDYRAFDKCRFSLYINLVESALDEENYYVARKYIRLTPQNVQKTNVERMQWHLALSKILYILGQNLDNSEKLKKLFSSLEKIEELGSFSNICVPEDDSLCYVVKIHEHIYQLTQEIYKLISIDPRLYTKNNKEVLQKHMGSFTLQEAKDVRNFGVTSLQNALEGCDTEIQNIMNNDNLKVYQCMARAYVKLAYHARNFDEDNEEAFIVSVLRATKLGSLEGRQLFPCLLSIDIGRTHKETFMKEISDIPPWMFLGWLPQMLANLDTPCIFAISEVLLKIAKIYPQSMVYPYRLSKEKYILQNDDVGITAREIIQELDGLLLGDKLIDTLLKALSYVCSPTVILTYYLKKVVAACTTKESVCSMAETLFQEVYSNFGNFGSTDSFQGKIYKTISNYEGKIKNILKGKFDSVKYRSAFSELLKELNELNEKLKEPEEVRKSSRLVNYSPWLASFQALELQSNIEIPGQYGGDRRPLVQYHVKIMGFLSAVNLQASLRAPIQLTILGNDAKEYPYLIKFGEDLRQDQRIEQIFLLMNNILAHDGNCNKRQLCLRTYQVIPLTSRLGVIEWLQHTEELRKFIEEAMDEEEHGTYKKTAGQYQTWINKALPGRQNNNHDCYKRACLKYSRDTTIRQYEALVSNVPINILRRAFSSISINSESFFALRHKFAMSYAVICVSHWLLGIGDRHLGNHLISIRNGQAIGIDFGHAFGTATQFLGIPEMVPFRLTPHILNLLQPLEKHGILQETMIHCLRAYRKNSDVLLATMNVFIKEPTLDWLEFAQKSELNSGKTLSQEWYPNKKLIQAQRKLQGVNPTSITIEDLKAGHSHTPEFLEACVNLVKGVPQHDFRAQRGDDLCEEDQVKCLLDQATDYNLLGRMYAGWQAWV